MIRVVALVLALLLPSQLWAAAVTLNANGTLLAQTTAAASPLNSTSLTIAAGSDIYLVCGVGSRDGTLPGVAMTWNGVAMTLLNSQTEPTWSNTAYIFGLASPATGNQTASLSWTGGSNQRVSYRCTAFNNVGSISGTLTNSNGNSADPQGNITTVSGDATYSVNTNSGSVTAVTHTELWADSNLSSAQYNLSTTTSDTHQYTMTAAVWAIAGVRLVQTGAAVSGCRLLQNGIDRRLLQNGVDGRILQGGGSCGLGGGGGGGVVPAMMMLGVGS